MPRGNDYSDEESECRAAFDWSFAKSEDILYGSYLGNGEEHLVLPRRVLVEMLATRSAVSGARTWGDLRRDLSRERLIELASTAYVFEEGPRAGASLDDLPDDLEVGFFGGY